MKPPSLSVLLSHIIGWLFFLSLPLLFITGHSSNQVIQLNKLLVFWMYFSVYPAIFYLHTYYLFPAFYLRKKYVIYGILVLLMFSGIWVLRPFDRTISSLQQPFAAEQLQGSQHRLQSNEKSFPGDPPPGQMPSGTYRNPPSSDFSPGNPPGRHSNRRGPGRGRPTLDIISVLLFILTLGLSITAQSVRRWRMATQLAAQAETDKVSAELSFLKAQINPHFLFNTLNNIYVLAISKDDNTADSIMRLSNIMRYVTDEVASDFVSLQSEANCIADYIDLQKMRLSKKAEIHYITTGDLETKSIAPLVLMTFVENVFKYGISSHEHSPITIQLVTEEQSIHFFCQNRIFPAAEIGERTGIGIANTKKRLQFLYPNRHLLTITDEDERFTVDLTLQS